MSLPSEMELVWTDSELLIRNPDPRVLSTLHYYHKSLEMDFKTYQRKVEKEKVQLYREMDANTVITFQGFLDDVVNTCKRLNLPYVFRDRRRPFPAPKVNFARGFRHGQAMLFFYMLNRNRSGLCKAPTRYGKSLRPNELVLMWDGSLKEAQAIRVGDQVMGPDSQPRTVETLGQGVEEMVEIVPNRGDPFGCNLSHILSLKCTGGAKFGGFQKGDVVNVTVEEYLKWAKHRKHCFKLYHTAIDFPEQPVPFDPWLVGNIIADGTRTAPELTKPDIDIQNAWKEWAAEAGLRVRDGKDKAYRVHISAGVKGGANPMMQMTRMCLDPNQDRIIPEVYKINSRTVRMGVLAGLIDGDGYLNNGMAYELATKYETLKNDIVFLARSLGFRVTWKLKTKGIKSSGFVGRYYILNIAGPIDQIPLKLTRKRPIQLKHRVNPLLTGFQVKRLGPGPYCGFTLKEDPLFVLGNFIVTHNTAIMANVMRAFPGLKTVVTAPGVDLLAQLQSDLQGWMPGREIRGIYTGSRGKTQSDDVTVISLDSLHKADTEGTRLLIVDEPHASAAPSRIQKMMDFKNARILGFGASLTGRFDGADKLVQGILGPVLVERTYQEAVQEGAICPIVVYMLKVPFRPWNCKDRLTAYRQLVLASPTFDMLIQRVLEEQVPSDWQSLVFVDEVKQADLLQKLIHSGHVAVASRMNKSKRREVYDSMVAGEIKRCIATDIYSTGLTFPDLRVMLNAAGGGGSITSVQKPGRLAQMRPGKSAGYVIDFLFEPSGFPVPGEGKEWEAVTRDCKARLNSYQTTGFDVRIVTSPDQIRLE
jgi:hypothetical protein